VSQPSYLLHLSDTHLPPEAGTLVQGVDPAHALTLVLDEVLGLPIVPIACVVSGDLTRDGELAAYRRLMALLSPLRERGIPLLLALGNHDARPAFRQALPELPFAFPDADAPCCYMQLVGDRRVIVLDSLLPGEVRGRLGADQLAWLDGLLRQPTPGGDLLVVHHPVTPPGMPWLDDRLLDDAAALAEVLRGRPLLGILSGHCHIGGATAFGGTLAITAPAVAFQFDPFPRDDQTVVSGHGYNLCTIQHGHLTVNSVLLHGGRPADAAAYQPASPA
jgi:3',5'-cyclic AMP phosphodiesterase CpdA